MPSKPKRKAHKQSEILYKRAVANLAHAVELNGGITKVAAGIGVDRGVLGNRLSARRGIKFDFEFVLLACDFLKLEISQILLPARKFRESLE